MSALFNEFGRSCRLRMAHRTEIGSTHMTALERSFDIFGLLSRHPNGASVKELSESLNTPPSSIHRWLQVLVDPGLRHPCRPIVPVPARTRGSPPQPLYLENQALATIARPHAPADGGDRRDQLRHGARRDKSICVAIPDCDRPLWIFIGIGQRMPTTLRPSPRAILAQDADVARNRSPPSHRAVHQSDTPLS